MDARILQHCVFLLFCLFFLSVPCFAKIFSFKEIHHSIKLDDQENQITFISPESVDQSDADFGNTPVVNPTTPGMNPPVTTTPTMNPTPPMITGPYINPNPISPPPPPPLTMTGPVTNPNPNPITPVSSGGSWCIASPTASQTALQVALDYACGFGGADCSPIQTSGSCFQPNTLRDHASYAFNSYYQKNPAPTSCSFGGTAQITYTDPSSGSCHFGLSTKTPTTTPTPTPPTPMTPINGGPINPFSPPSPMTPINPFTPGGTGYGSGSEPTDIGLEPTGTPSGAKSITYNLSLFSTVTCFMLMVVARNYF